MRDFNLDSVIVGRPYQGIHEQSASQKYPIGMIYKCNGRRWRYCKAYGNFQFAYRGCPNLNIVPGDTGGSAFGIEGSPYGAIDKGVTELLVGTTTAFAVDWFTNGSLIAFPATVGYNDIICIRVLGNDLGNGTSVKIYLDEPLPVALLDSDGVNVHPSPYGNVGDSGAGSIYNTRVVVPAIKALSGYYFWGQTKGPCWVTPSPYGAGRIKVFNPGEGTIKDQVTADINQVAGVAIPKDTGAYGDGMIFLMLE